MVSLLALVVAASADIRSYWNIDAWQSVRNGKGRALVLVCGCVAFAGGAGIPFLPNGHSHFDNEPYRSDVLQSLWHFELHDPGGPEYGFVGPLLPLLLLLLIIPVRWLFARPASAPAFPVITDAKRE